MTIQEAYITYLQLSESNFTNANLNTDKARFVNLYNYVQIRYVEWVLEKRNQDDLRDVQLLLNIGISLDKDKEELEYVLYDLPTNYLNSSNLSVYASYKKCKNVRLYTFEVQNDNVEEYLADIFNKPSFHDRETFYTKANNKVVVYKSDFDISDVKLSYYRYPKKVDIEGYENLEGKTSTNTHPELDDKAVNRIIAAMVKEHDLISNDLQKHQLSTNRLFSEV